jgi:phosphatidylserine decarboxylase
MDLHTSYGPLAVTQIAGAIARRIVCDLAVGDRVKAGDRMGLIRFGSRVDLFLPLAADLRVKKGQQVRSSATVMASMADSAAGDRHVA